LLHAYVTGADDALISNLDCLPDRLSKHSQPFEVQPRRRHAEHPRAFAHRQTFRAP
jgi:hypothetical protein